MKRVGLVGLGWHARRRYAPWLAKQPDIHWVVGVDRSENRPQIEGLTARPETLLYDIAPHRLADFHLDALLIATDPRSRLPWMHWALDHHLDILVDKPLSAPDSPPEDAAVAHALRTDLEDLLPRASQSRSRVSVQTQRRAHAGYLWLRRLLRDTVEQTGVPITHLDIHHADGMWVMPHEWDRTHHPYRHRAGKLLHSGYHFLDLASWLLEVSDPEAGELHFAVQQTRALDVDARLSTQRVLELPPSVAGSHHGEVDVQLQGQLRVDDRVRTVLRMDLQAGSISRRHRTTPPADPYKGAGRIRHERVSVNIGPFLTAHVHSYQSHEIGEAPQTEYGPGHLDHFDISVYRSPLLPGPRFETIDVGRDHPQHNEAARHDLLRAFLDGSEVSSLASHVRPTRLLASIYEALAAEGRGCLPWGYAQGLHDSPRV